MKNCKFKLILGISIFACLLNSCTNLTDSNKNNKDSGFAEISFLINDADKNPSPERKSYVPSDVSEDEIVEVKLSYEMVKSDDGSSSPNTSDVIEKTYKSISDFKAAAISIELGKYNFYLNLFATDFNERPRLVQSGKLENINITSGKNTLTFNTSFVQSGDCRISYIWNADENDDNRIGLIKMGLFTQNDKGEDVAAEGFDFEEIEFSQIQIDDQKCYQAVYSKTDIPNDTYMLKIQLWDTDQAERSILNTFIDFVSIYGYKTIGSRTLANKDYNQNYFITYNLNDGEEIIPESGNSAFVNKHNSKTAVNLPDGTKIQREGYKFKGWYTTSDFQSNTKISIISLSSEYIAKDITLYARWQTLNPVLYVSTSGDDKNDGSQGNPLKTIEAACQKMQIFGGSDSEWVIHLDGVSTDSVQYFDDVIQDEISGDVAKSILLTGASIYEDFYLDTDGKIKKCPSVTISISLCDKDINVTVLYDNDDGDYSTTGSISSSKNIVFKADEGFDSYSWTFEGDEPDQNKVKTSGENGEILLLDTSLFNLRGTYDVLLEATKTENGTVKHYSYCAQINNQD
ncbi:MAG: InlB B-repeat-containing protein [Treponema sp.]|nr:InlB B-repeat-containing protein [Treponema sp.]